MTFATTRMLRTSTRHSPVPLPAADGHGTRSGRPFDMTVTASTDAVVTSAGAHGLLHRFVRDLVYGANDGIITTFAVVAGVSGANLSSRIVLILGVANLVADGFSMGASNWLGIRSERDARDAAGGTADRGGVPESSALAHGFATFAAFAIAGIAPLVAYFLPIDADDRFASACVLALGAQFAVGAARTVVTRQRWWTSGLEMLLVGAAAAGVAWGMGRWVATLTGVHGA